MEGSRLILKRHVPRGRQRLAVMIALGGLIALVVMFLQFKMTLSAQSLANVSRDVSGMSADLTNTLSQGAEKAAPAIPATPTEENIAELKVLLQQAMKNSQTPPAAASTAGTELPQTPSLPPSEPVTPPTP